MARGWESKAVESQQDDAREAPVKRPPLTAEERALQDRRKGLEMALARAQAELQAACQPAYRDMLRLKVEALRGQLAELG